MTNVIRLRPATLEDVPILAEMNQQLIIDEGSPNPMDLAELKQRMVKWLSADRDAVIVERGEEIIGYMLFWRMADEFYPYKDSIYIRQFFIQPSFRRRGIGQVAFDRIIDEFLDEGAALTLDVLESNPEGKAFWAKLGFLEYHTTMRRS
ncbi:MAG: hypothetical protein Phog2KO_39840 [Phototrophicaceae bacterium]